MAFPNKSSQFKKGESGNRSGRPRGAKNLSTVLSELLEKVAPEQIQNAKAISEFCKKKKITVQDALAARLLYEAVVNGNIKAFAEINKILGNYAPTKIAETDTKGNDKPKVVVYLPDNGRNDSK